MRLPRRQFLHLAAGAAALSAASRMARAQAYPTRLVRIIVGFAAGGGRQIFFHGDRNRFGHNGIFAGRRANGIALPAIWANAYLDHARSNPGKFRQLISRVSYHCSRMERRFKQDSHPHWQGI
jgi:hypothetical protein